MKNKVFILALLISIMAVTGLQAQNLPGGIWASPQSNTTEGRYRSNADDFIRPDAYTGLKLNKWFGMTAFLWDPNDYSAIATAGFAANAGGLYIGAFYSGNFWANTPAYNYTERTMDPAPADGETDKVYNVYNNVYVTTGSVNNVALLFGIADMGIRLTYRTNHQSFNKSDIVVGNQLYKNYYAESGYIAPQIAWSMAKDLTPNGIRPYVTADLNFVRNNQKTETSGGISGENIGRSANHFDPSLGLGMGGLTFYNKDGFKGSFDFDYVLTLNIYDNEYSYKDGSSWKTASIKGTYSPSTFSYIERSFISNQLTPSLSGSWSKERLALKFKLNLPLTLSTNEQNTMDLNASNELIKEGDSDSTTTFTFRPDLRLALQYKIIPDKLTLNAGARIQATALNIETVTRNYYTDNNKDWTRNIHQDSFGTGFVNRFSIGLTFNFTENAWVEATTGAINVFGNSAAIDVFAPGGLFSFGSILAGLKF